MIVPDNHSTRRWLGPAAVALLIALSLTRAVDDPAEGYYEQALTRALVTFGLARALVVDDRDAEDPGYRLCRGVAVGERWTKELYEVFSDPKTYRFDVAKGCEFMPGVGVRLKRGDDR